MPRSDLKYAAFLRGINVGGRAVLPMSELRGVCTGLGLKNVRTYIQSGNVLFESPLRADAIAGDLEKALAKKMGKEILVVVRTVDELAEVLKKNPFPRAEPAKVGVMFFGGPPEKDFLRNISTTTGEEVRLGKREVYIHYPAGMGQTKLKLPKQSERGTVRNINTLRKMIALGEQG